jgi:dihydrofolate synthase/folylpolyglutamate synthase
VNGKEVTDQALGDAFTTINQQRQDIPLTAFEFLTLAALKIFKQNELDVIILEVGMGGRRDAVNIIDADVAIITNVAMDHQNWLGAAREAIAAEKVGILRQGKPVIFGESNLPQALIDKVSTLQTPLFIQGKDFTYRVGERSFSWQYHTQSYRKLPLPKLAISNVSIALMAIQLLQNRLPVTQDALQNGIVAAKLVGRMHIVSKPIMQIFDVAHNPAAAKFLACNLEKYQCRGKTSAIFSMFKDKDIVNTILPLTKIVDIWYIAPLQHERAASIKQLALALQRANIQDTYKFLTVKDAYLASLANSTINDRVIIYGSFRTVAEILT